MNTLRKTKQGMEGNYGFIPLSPVKDDSSDHLSTSRAYLKETTNNRQEEYAKRSSSSNKSGKLNI